MPGKEEAKTRTRQPTPSVQIPEERRAPLAGRLRAILAGFAWAALAVAIFSGWFVVTRFSVTRVLTVWDVALLRFGVGAVLLSPILFLPGSRPRARAWREGLLFSLLWGLPFVLLVALGLQLTSAAQAASITPTMMPVFAGAFAALFLRQRQGRMRWAGYLFIVAGLCALVAAGAATHGTASPLGVGALILAAAMWAVYTLLFRRGGLTPLQSAALICAWSAILFLPAYLLLGLGRLAQAPPAEIAIQAVYQGALMSGVALIAFNRSVSLLGPGAATAMIALVPAAASLLAIPALGEWPSPTEALAIGGIVLGLLLAARPAPSS
ncbi:DMT family transporter [Roseomonas marmotae]|uniref:DMT family transporter n=1 Tax=Roseomonas marmotae TaxID=2768161 RepID=UPI001F1B5DF1|nr:DMT family transporter [Roseomonas marmotae]